MQDTVPHTEAGAHPRTQPLGGAAKRAFDLAVAIPATIVLAPVMAGLAAWVRIDSPGPAVFRQKRAGAFGRPFTCFKFRSMVDGAERKGAGLKVTEDDDRITRAGRVLRRLSLDELPQLINVIRGDMSIVGPRPTVPAQIAHYDTMQRRRLLARPGMTGLAQVQGRYHTDAAFKVGHDLQYLVNWSLVLDVQIIVRT
ncbi:MAG: sugar transferase, partial [Miltoncostaeaceae bacterium]